jgi:hypothetical protein
VYSLSRESQWTVLIAAWQARISSVLATGVSASRGEAIWKRSSIPTSSSRER